MAGASMKDIKLRIKSVESTMQITKAMELVASPSSGRRRNVRKGVVPILRGLSRRSKASRRQRTIFPRPINSIAR